MPSQAKGYSRSKAVSTRIGHGRAADAVKTVASSDEIADRAFARSPSLRKRILGLDEVLALVEIVDAGVRDFEMDLAAGGESRIGEIFHDFVLRVDGDAFAAGEVREIDVVGAAVEAEIHSVMHQAFARSRAPRPRFVAAGPRFPARERRRERALARIGGCDFRR